MRVYLCGPIHGCEDSECRDWREEAKAIFPGAIDPLRRDYRGREAENVVDIVELDKVDIMACDALLVNYVRPSVGASMEIHLAWTIGKPIVLWCKEGENLSPWLTYHVTHVVHSLEQAVEALGKINPDEIPSLARTMIEESLVDDHPELLFADGFEAALMGYMVRFGAPPVALYDRHKCIDILIERDGMSPEEAEEHFEYNVIGGWVGEYTPAFAVLPER